MQNIASNNITYTKSQNKCPENGSFASKTLQSNFVSVFVGAVVYLVHYLSASFNISHACASDTVRYVYSSICWVSCLQCWASY